MMRMIVLYAALTMAIIGLAAWLLTLTFADASAGGGAGGAIRLSAIVATVVQLAAFVATKLVAPRNVMAAWGAGSLVRLLTLLVYAFVAVKLLNLPATPALLSLVVFFFLATLLEPLFLRR